jgi:putative addiction module component (TIGR02574 family)
MTHGYNRAMATPRSTRTLEKAVLQLKPRARAKLVHALVDSLEGLSRKEIDSLWLDEAERRAAELESGKVAAVPGEKVFARIEAKYKKK